MTVLPISPSPTASNTSSGSCWATAPAPISRPRPMTIGSNRPSSPGWRWPTSMKTATWISSSPTSATSTALSSPAASRWCSATPTARSSAAQTVATSLEFPYTVKTADLNGDDHADLVYNLIGTTPGAVVVQLGNGDGTLRGGQHDRDSPRRRPTSSWRISTATASSTSSPPITGRRVRCRCCAAMATARSSPPFRFRPQRIRSRSLPATSMATARSISSPPTPTTTISRSC